MSLEKKVQEIKKCSNRDLQENRKIIDTLGNGTFGTVFKIEYQKKVLAMKTTSLKNVEDEDDYHGKILASHSEFELLKAGHPYVVRSYDYFLDEKKKEASITMDLMSQDLEAFIEEKKRLPFQKVYEIFQDVLTGQIIYNPEKEAFF